ncbi:MAG: DegT/DnrJ/EryC1/StrS family aminotransferase [Planctomycetaceae bacterium]|nr:DegT/DnrJ/EryC1/StrS family aminotransferase [Planctomycetaceae bacterium]
MKESIPMSSADLSEADVEAVLEVVRSGRLALGPKTAEFERRMAEYCGVKHAIATNSGTAALHVLVIASGIGPGDEVLVPSFTFAASVNAILYERATPVFVDIEPDTYNLDPDDVARKITPRTKAIMAVDVFGHPAEWDALQAVADKHGLPIIDDCCEALGAEYRGRKLGQFGVAGAFAFYPNKQMTTGEGGIIVTNDDRINELSRSLCNQGRGEKGEWLEHERLGYNYRLDEMSSALGVSQLKRLPEFLDKRENVARAYIERLRNCDWATPMPVRAHVRKSWFVFVITMAPGIDLARVQKYVAEKHGIPLRRYFNPVHEQTYVARQFGSTVGPLPVTDAVSKRTLAIPFHNNLSLEEIEQVVDVLGAAVGYAS